MFYQSNLQKLVSIMSKNSSLSYLISYSYTILYQLAKGSYKVYRKYDYFLEKSKFDSHLDQCNIHQNSFNK